MKIRGFRTLAGPNVFHHRPILVMDLDIGEFEQRPSSELPGFTERLLELLPGLRAHHCSRRKEGGFEERLREGTYMGHIIEHITLELSSAAGIEVGFGKTVSTGEPGLYEVAVRYVNEEGMRYLLRSSVQIAIAIAQKRPFQLGPCIEEARRIVERTALGPSTSAVAAAAEARGIPVHRLDQQNLIQLGHGRNRKLIQATTTQKTNTIAVDIAQDKHLTKKILRDARIPVPRGHVVNTEGDAREAFQALKAAWSDSSSSIRVPGLRRRFSAVVKPVDANRGKGISLGLNTSESVGEAFHRAREHSSKVIVEEQLEGRDFRVTVVAGKMAAAAERIPAHVVGDGLHTIRELIERENKNPMRGEGHDRPMTKLRVDETAEHHLRRQHIGLDDIAEGGRRVYLRGTANLSTGGSARDVTDLLHPETRAICERAARVLDLDVCGLDVILTDPSKPLLTQGGGIVEANASPGIRMHHHPREGKARDVGSAIIESLYPDGATGRIPIAAVTGTNGKTTTTRLLGQLLREKGHTVGMTTSDGIFINDDRIGDDGTSEASSARSLLSDPAVEIAVLETRRGDILHHGLAFDWCDVAVITNVQPDHFGQDGLENLDDLLHVKCLVAERVKEGGVIVLNADDPLLCELADSPRLIGREKVLFSLDWKNPAVLGHLARGGIAFVMRENGGLYELTEDTERQLGRAAEFPITMDGLAEFQISNLLGAVAAARSLGVPIEQVRHSLLLFEPAARNPGRMEFYRVGAGHVLLDHAHNPPAIRAAGTFARTLGRSMTGVIGIPGSRSDSLIEEAGREAARIFDRIVIREDQDSGCRNPGEVAGILERVIHAEYPEIRCVIERDEALALNRAIAEMEPGELVVFFHENHAAVMEILEDFGATPLRSVPPADPGRRGETEVVPLSVEPYKATRR